MNYIIPSPPANLGFHSQTKMIFVSKNIEVFSLLICLFTPFSKLWHARRTQKKPYKQQLLLYTEYKTKYNFQN
jgi:hypothetical protein